MRAPPADWSRWGGIAREAARRALEVWFRGAAVRGGEVRGAAAWLAPGALASDGPLGRTLLHAMMARGVPRQVSDAFAGAVATAWGAWFAGYSVLLHLDPETDVVAPVSIRAGSSSAEAGLGPRSLAAAIRARLGPLAETPEGAEAVVAFARWFGRGFARWRERAVLQEVRVDPETGGLTSRRSILRDLGAFGG